VLKSKVLLKKGSR